MNKSTKQPPSVKTLAIRGVFFNWIGRGCSFVIMFFLTPYLVHTLGDERYGLWSIVMSLTSYYALADMGLRGAGTKYIAQFHALDDRESINKVVVTSLVVYVGLSLVVVFLTGVAAWVFPLVFPIGDVSETTIRWIVVLTGGTVVFRLISQVFNATLTALQRHDISNAAAVTVQVTQAIAVVLALSYGYGLLGMAVATLIVAMLGQITRSIIAARLLPGLSLSWRYFDHDTFKLVFRFGTLTTFPRVARRMTEQFGTVIIGVMLGPGAVIFYDIAQRLSSKSQAFGRSIVGVIFPLASRADAKKDQQALRQLLILGPRLLAALTLSLSVILILMGRNFIDLWIGEGYSLRSHPILCLLSLAMVARMSCSPLRAILRGTARLRLLAKAGVVEVVTTLILGPILIAQFGIIGMAWAVLLVQVAVGGLLLPWGTCRALKYSYGNYLRQVWLPAMSVAALALGVPFPLSIMFAPTRMLHLLPQFLLVGAVAAVSIYFICLDSHRRKDILATLRTSKLRPPRDLADPPQTVSVSR